MSNFPSSRTRNITSHSKENLAFHSLLRWKVIIIQIFATSLMHFLFKRLGECTSWATFQGGGLVRVIRRQPPGFEKADWLNFWLIVWLSSTTQLTVSLWKRLLPIACFLHFHPPPPPPPPPPPTLLTHTVNRVSFQILGLPRYFLTK